MTTPHPTNEMNSSDTDTAQLAHALLARLDRSDRALRRWRLAAQVCAGAILFGAGIAAGSSQSAKDPSQPKQPEPSPSGPAQSKSVQASPMPQDAAAAAPGAAAVPPQPQAAARSGSRMVGIALDLNPSGRWNSTLLAVDEDGVVYALNTAGPKPVWQRFTFSP